MDKIERRAVSRLLVPTQVRGVPLGQEAPEPTCASRGDERPTGTYPAYRRSRVDRRLPGIPVEVSAERARNPRPRAQPPGVAEHGCRDEGNSASTPHWARFTPRSRCSRFAGPQNWASQASGCAGDRAKSRSSTWGECGEVMSGGRTGERGNRLDGTQDVYGSAEAVPVCSQEQRRNPATRAFERPVEQALSPRGAVLPHRGTR